ncbi:MAG TPA: cupin domain-containing protein [Stellaceae bacterium]|nr:cupin domain-containing protein [Stellaceae bacterium]
MEIRRIVTGHDERGRAVFRSDERLAGVPVEGGVAEFAVAWSTTVSPADNDDPFDGAKRAVGLACPGGTVLRFVDIAPGRRSPMHRTNSIDYGIVLAGELDLELDDGAVRHLHAGDVVVQRGTMHAWVNNGTVPCRMAFVLIDAKPAAAGGRTLDPTH